MKKNIFKVFALIKNTLKQIFVEKLIYNNFVIHPTVVNFPITGKCNMKCIMCNVWKKENQHNYEISSEQISEIFSQKLFKNVKHVGISGGEPFTRNDIDSIINGIINNLPKLRSISIISNGTLTKRIIEKIPKIFEICENNNIKCSISFSIDGISDIHNKVRGNKDSFNNLLNTLEALKGTNIYKATSLCCTITKVNLNNLFQILEFAKMNKLYIKFRLATEIERLNNNDLKENFNFTRENKITIVKFLDKLCYEYEKQWHQMFYYKALKEKLLYNNKRTFGCDWKTKGISLDAEGNLYYCFVKSPKISNLVNDDGWRAYNENIIIRDNIKRKYCDECIHDYVGSIDLEFKLKFLFMKIVDKIKRKLNILKLYVIRLNKRKILIKKQNINLRASKQNIFITGWYGTETTGDKAILGGIYSEIIEKNPNANFIVSSIVPYYTEETINELKFKNTIVVERNSKDEIKLLLESDLVVMGGGPLMDIEETVDIMWSFYRAIKNNIPTCIYSCGIGPLNSKRYRKVVKTIFELSCFTYVRDKNSADYYKDIIKNVELKVSTDPAVAYLIQYSNYNYRKNNKALVCIRDWPKNYTRIKDENEFKMVKNEFLDKFCEGIRYMIENGKEVHFFPMNTFFYGGDDREYYKEVKEKLGKYSEKCFFYEDEYTTNETINIFLKYDFVIGMRFHSVVFGNTLGIPTIAIDYDTNKGKIYGFMKSINMEENYIYINDMLQGDIFVNKIKSISLKDTRSKLEYSFNKLLKIIDNPIDDIYKTIN